MGSGATARTVTESAGIHDRGPGPAGGLKVAAEALDVGPTYREQWQLVAVTPARELAKVQRRPRGSGRSTGPGIRLRPAVPAPRTPGPPAAGQQKWMWWS